VFPFSSRHSGRTVAAGAVIGLLAATAGCGSSAKTAGPSSTVTGGAPAATSAASDSAAAGGDGVAYAQAQLAKYSGLITHFDPPGPSLSNVKAKLAGKTVWYVPVFLQAPIFTANSKGLTEPLALAGASLHVCDAASNPSQGDSCIKQAVAAKAGAIIIDAINYSFASKAIDSALAAQIPVVATDNDDRKGFPSNPLLTTVSIGGPQVARLSVDYVIADSKGKANALYAADDSDAGKIAAAATADEFTTRCPDCKVTTVNFSDLTVQRLATAVSSAMAANSKIDYVYGGYDAPSGIFALQGAKTVSGRKFTYVTGTGQPPGLQRVAAGQQAADAGVDTSASMWNTADALFRIVTGVAPIADYVQPLRVFTKANVPGNTSDAGAYASGEWYTDGSFKPMYKTLWGL